MIAGPVVFKEANVYDNRTTNFVIIPKGSYHQISSYGIISSPTLVHDLPPEAA